MLFFYPAIKQEQVGDGHKPGAGVLVVRACVCSWGDPGAAFPTVRPAAQSVVWKVKGVLNFFH